MTTTSKLGLELLANAAANQTLANTTFAQLNQLVQAGVVDRITTPPGSPANEALYIIAATATGVWAGKENQLAYWLTSANAWQYITPREGMLVHVNDEDVYYKYTGSAWSVLETVGTSLAVVQTFTGNKTLALTDINTYNVSQDATAQTVTLPAQATVVWTADAEIHIEQGGAGTVTVTGATGVTINGVSAGSFALAGQFSVVTLKRVASNTWTLLGGIASAVVTGPASAGDGNLALFNGTTGKVIKDGGTVTAAGLALLDDASAAAQATTLGLGTGNSPTFTALALSNGQIVFPATQVPSANANTLDDYEEGTWTPVITFDTPGDLSVVYSVQSGTYTKIGRAIALTLLVRTSTFTHTTASGVFRVTGVPFAGTSIGIGASNWRGITKANYTDVVSRIDSSATNVTLMISGSGQATTNVVATDMPTGGSIEFFSSFVYNTTT